MTARTCSLCQRPAIGNSQKLRACAMHLRLKRMRWGARVNHKYVPSMAELEALAESLREMACPHCGREMCWAPGTPLARRVTLQHDRDGTIRLICYSCNSAHASHIGDQFYAEDRLSAAMSVCVCCGLKKPHAEFHRNRSRRFGIHSSCRQCEKDAGRKRALTYYHRNRERINHARRHHA